MVPTARSGGSLATEFITKLPAEEHDLPHWQTAMTVLLLSAEHGQAGADPMMARIAMARVLNADSDAASEMSAPRRKRAKRYEIVR